MANLQKYTVTSAYVEAGLLTEAASVSVARKTNAQQVATLFKGFAGVSPGAAIMEVQIENAVPSADFELNPGPFMKKLQVVEMSFFAAGKVLTSKGFIIEDNFGQSVGSESKLSFTAWLAFEDWE